MKSALGYLTVVKLKNQLKGILKSPSKLVYGLFLVAMLALAAFSGSNEAEIQARPLSELVAILVLFYSLMFFLVFLNGSASNTPMFTLSDVTVLFPAPINPKRILFYGLFRQLGLSLLLGFFLLFQYSWLHSLYEITYPQLLLIILGYALTLFFAQLCAMAVYVRFSGRDNASRVIKGTVAALTVIYLIALLLRCRENILPLLSGEKNYEGALNACVSFLSTLPGLLFPVSGWAAGLVGGIFTQNIFELLLCSFLLLGLLLGLLFSILLAKNNYYEDVLQTAEVAQSNVTAQKEGKMAEVVPKHVKVGKVGLRRGAGASAIYYKHKVENRRSGIFIFSNVSLIFAAILIFSSLFFRFMDDGAGLVAVFSMGTYFQLFSVALGRFNRELTKPYLYLIPEPPLKKLLYALKENLIAEVFEAVLIFVPAALILHASPWNAALCILGRFSFSLLFTAGNVVVERVFGSMPSKVLIFFFYFLVLILLAAPGITAGIFLMAILPEWDLLPLIAGIFCGNLLCSLLALFLCRNLLQYAELNNR